ncbi:zinc-dependent metalloprotease [Pinibacter aurantiacus]|uniref:Zinc-dependent metalloprotease n=1 Tax=Pinibacter aurantiacus TaxID=2851599 RepID=A0A9E2SA40_9BACT|nr:zinc-dependent metalloprotease [Pinibacter aurantiacus]MBV4359258.1 zinc-dependent metalloprotease [Pinibacter aurantiacus]
MKQVFLSIILCGFLSAIGYAQTNVAAPTAIKTTSGSYNQIVKPGTLSKKGLFSIYKTDDKYFFEIPDSLLGRQLLLTTWLVKVPGGSPKFGGEVMNTRVITFEKERGKIALKVVTILQETDSTNAISKAIKNSNINPIAVLFDVKSQGTGGRSSIIDVTDFLQKENSFTILNSEVKRGLSVGSMAPDRSFVKSFAAYPINVEVKMLRTYSASGGGAPAGVGARPAAAPLEAAQIGGAITLEISTSIFLMPEKPMMPRRFDARVGYFADAYNEFADEQQKADTKIFIVRQRLEPKPEDIEKYKRGELVEPKEQIVYYVDPATPKQWRPYIIAGINDWNEAFKAAGFKNAIVGKEWPENDTTMSLEDARYKIVRYFPSEVANAYGPNIHDPRSGEVLQSYVGWYHNVMTLLHDWYMIQAGPNDPRARKMKFSDSLMGTLIRFVSSHEVGHTLGLRHNMGSSSLTPVEKLRDKHWVEAHGHTNSIMDYARFNYVAQPEDSIGEAGLMPRINDYDKWAIKWGYTWTDAKDDEADKKIVSQWIVDSLKANPRLWFGGEGMNNDARCQSEDLGDDNMKANEYGIKNLKYVMAHLAEWTKEDNDLYTNLVGVYRQVVSQYLRYVLHVTKNVASTYETWKTVEQPGNIYAPEPAAKQREAVAFLNKEVFTTPDWLLSSDILNKISNPVRLGSVSTVQSRVLDQLLSDRVLYTLLMHERRYGKDSCYTMIAFLNDLKSGIWSELKTKQPIDIYRRSIQKNYISNVFAAIKEAEAGSNLIALFMGGAAAQENTPVTMSSDVGSYLALHLEKLRSEILAAIPTATDKDTKDHLIYVAQQIKTGLKNQF